MNKTNHTILLVFDSIKELELIETNLIRNGFQILKSENLDDALTKVKNVIPDLIVVNTANTEKDVEAFSKQVKMKYLKKVILPRALGLEDYLTIKTSEHLVIRSLMLNKVYRNNKIAFFISQNKFVSPSN
jgi:response regulator RpfG family c-di-GMP phosphodiesterase